MHPGCILVTFGTYRGCVRDAPPVCPGYTRRCVLDAPKVRPGCGTLWFPSDNVGSPAHLRPSGRLAFCTPGNPAREPVSEITKHLPAIGLMKELVARTFVDS